MLALTQANNSGVEYTAMRAWLPGLRNEALIKLGLEFDSWYFDGPRDLEQKFFARLCGDRDEAKTFVADLLGCCRHTAKRQLRFYSQADVDFLTEAEIDRGLGSRDARFVIDAHRLADKIQENCGPRLFTASVSDGF